MIRRFSDIRKKDIGIVGGKGANLGEMVNAGLNVPNGFVITSKVYKVFLEKNKLNEFIDEKLQKAGEDERELTLAAKEIRDKILKSSISEDIKFKIEDEYKRLGRDVRVAVRSSATAEDLVDASFAGQQETYLNVQGAEDIFKQVLNCYASLWGNRAVLYRKNKGYNHSDVAMAVVIQRMVESEFAGVMFTANPVNNKHSEVQINASYGLGESVVSGRVTADTYICDKDGNPLQITIGDKKTQMVYDAKGIKECAVSEKLQKTRCLDDTQLIELCVSGRRVERFYKAPMDIEWAIAGKAVYILQARPITTLVNSDSKVISEEDIQKYISKCNDNGDLKKKLAFILEKIPMPYYPLDSQFAKAMEDQKSKILKEAGVIMSMQPQMFDDGVMILPDVKTRITTDIFKIFGLYKELNNYELCRQNLSEQMPLFKAELESYSKKNFDKMKLKEACDNFMTLYNFIERLCYLRFKYAVFSSFLSNNKINKVLSKLEEKYTIYDLYSNLDYKTATVNEDICKLAKAVQKDDKAKEEILDGLKYDKVCEKYPKLKKEFDKFMEKNGYKSDFNCYCTYGKSFKENPDRLLNIIKPLLSSDSKPEEDKFSALMTKIKGVCSTKQFTKLEKCIDDLRYFHKMREESQYYWEQAFYYERCILKRISNLLYENDKYEENVAYLFVDELKQISSKGLITEELKAKIETRKANRALAFKVWDRCKMLVFGANEDVLKGVSGSQGEVIGRVCIINGPEEFYKMRSGDILVCKYTDPEWTPLFNLCKGVVSDTGSALSHAAIVAREFGIPAVLGVGFATSNFKDGDTIHVDATKGEVSKVG